jgi:hypothetical protein
MKWFTLKSSASRVIGRSLSTDPSIQRWGDGFHGTASPVFGSFAKSDAAEKIKGTEHEAALCLVILTPGAGSGSKLTLPTR